MKETALSKMLLCLIMGLTVFVSSTTLWGQDRSNAKIWFSYFSYETMDAGLRVSELYVNIQTDKLVIQHLGTYSGSVSPTFPDDVPRGAVATAQTFWAGIGTRFALVPQSGKVVVLKSEIGDEDVGPFTQFKTFTTTATRFTAIEEPQVALIDPYSRALSLKNPVMFGYDVMLLQSLLMQSGFTGVGAIDGYFGANTDKALRAFQQNRRLTVNGVTSEAVWNAFGFELLNE